jgi:dolichyl-phosphate-mannose--protein O-mannosyl transferase
MNGIPWILIAILVALVLFGIVALLAVRKRKEPRKIDCRNYFVTGVVWLATGLALSLLPWFLHGEVSFTMGGFFFVLGLAYAIKGLLNKDKWGTKVEVSPTTARSMMIVTIALCALIVLVFALFALFSAR